MSSNGNVLQNLDELFPEPALPPSRFSPQRLPGANPESVAALQHVLKDNHRRYHIFFNDRGFHNHITHRALAVYAVGGSGDIIKDYYERDGKIQRPAFKSPEPITEVNFVDHLGDENYYQAYVAFFSEQVSVKGAARTLEEFVFSEKYNFRKGEDERSQPEMLSRLFSGLVHPMIHAGYGVEFGLKGMLVEGLALGAIHGARVKEFVSSHLFSSDAADGIETITSHLGALGLNGPSTTNAPSTSKTGGVHVFDIVAQVLKDDRLHRNSSVDIAGQYVNLIVRHTATIKEYTEKWTIDPSQPGEIERKMEEVVWLSSLLYGVGGLEPDGRHQADFFLMHLVTSSLFLPSLIAYLTPRSQVLLLRAYLIIAITWWVLRGRPDLNIKSFMTTTSVEPSVPTTPAAKAPLTTETTPTPNPFLPILQSAITHPNDHLIKIQRAFAHCDTLYGRRTAGYFEGTELEGAELLDGSLFLRSALLTADHVGWVREGKEPRPFTN